MCQVTLVATKQLVKYNPTEIPTKIPLKSTDKNAQVPNRIWNFSNFDSLRWPKMVFSDFSPHAVPVSTVCRISHGQYATTFIRLVFLFA